MVPIAYTPVAWTHWLPALGLELNDGRSVVEFRDEIARAWSVPSVEMTASGNAAVAILLRALMKESSNRQVVVPAYAHASLAAIILKLGLVPVLVDSTADRFTQRHDVLSQVVTDETLCVIVSHPFGLPAYGEDEARMLRELPCPVIEDCTQALGSRWNRQPLGLVGRAAWISFGRGENLSTHGGGAILLNDIEMTIPVRRLAGELERERMPVQLKTWFMMKGVAIATHPWMYRWTWPLARSRRTPRVAEDYSRTAYSPFQASVGRRLWRRMEVWAAQRKRHGERLGEGLAEVKGIVIPKGVEGGEAAMNRFPVLVRHRGLREQVRRALWKAGIETTTHYQEPIHRALALGYDHAKDPFPQATYMTERMVTLPVHPGVQPRHLTKMIEVIRKNCG